MSAALGKFTLLRDEKPGAWGYALANGRAVFGFSAQFPGDRGGPFVVEIADAGAVRLDHQGVFYALPQAWVLPNFSTAHRNGLANGSLGFSERGHCIGFPSAGEIAMADIKTGEARQVGKPTSGFSGWSVCLGPLGSHITLFSR